MSTPDLLDRFIGVIDKFTRYVEAQTEFSQEQTKIIHSLYEQRLKEKCPEAYESITNSK
jgi:hypothetical protein